MKKLLILGAGEMQVPIIKRARNMGVDTFVVDMNVDAPGIQYANHYKIIDTTDREGVLSYAKEIGIDGLLTTSDYPVNVVAYVSNVLDLHGKLSSEVASLCTNKFKTREFLHSHGFNCPRYKVVSNLEEALPIDYFPCIIKPIDSSASRGVKKIESEEELKRDFPLTQSYSRTGKVIIEEFIEGKEFSVETLTQARMTDVINITEKLCIGEEKGFFVEDTHIEPARISPDLFIKIKKTVIEILSAMNFDNCPSHTEIKVNDNGIYVIEIACRLGGDYITSDLVPLSTGVSMLDNLIRLALNEKIDTTRSRHFYSFVQFLNPSNYDKCVEFIGNHKDEIVRYDIKPKKEGEIRNSLDRLGYLIMSKRSEMEVNNVLEIIR